MFLIRERFGSTPSLALPVAAIPVLALAIGLAAGLLLARHSGPPIAPSAAMATSAATVAAAASRYSADVVRVIDGDTFEARVRAWPRIEVVTKVRLRDIDAPELKGRCVQESEQAQAARDALAAMLAEGSVSIGRVSLDKYGGRVLANASTAHTGDVASVLLVRGHARPYAGRQRQSWCG
jgi:endonuclease YncB( thermonuclease family)